MKAYNSQKGFSLLEMLIYVSILSLLLVVVIGVLTSVARSYDTLKISKTLNHAAIVSLERITREVRNASGVQTGQSIFGSSPGRLYLSSGVDTVDFYISEGMLMINKNGAFEGPLTSPDVSIIDLVFNYSTTTRSEFVTVNMTLQSGTSTKMRTEKFYSTIVLRGSY